MDAHVLLARVQAKLQSYNLDGGHDTHLFVDGDKVIVVPFYPPRAGGSPREMVEPHATLSYGQIEIRLVLTYFHHIRNFNGWCDRRTDLTNGYYRADLVVTRMIELFEKMMWQDLGYSKEA